MQLRISGKSPGIGWAGSSSLVLGTHSHGLSETPNSLIDWTANGGPASTPIRTSSLRQNRALKTIFARFPTAANTNAELHELGPPALVATSGGCALNGPRREEVPATLKLWIATRS